MGATAHKATQSTRPSEVERGWFVVDATDLILGRMATQIATILRGKHRPIFTPHVDTGEYVIVVNAEKIKLTGNKMKDKKYYTHSGHQGSLKEITAEKLLASAHSDRVVRKAVTGMLPKGSLGRQMASKLKVYAGPNHRNQAQKPKPLEIK